MKLYLAPRTRAVRARWILEELEAPYELIRLDLAKHETTTPEHLALNPLGEVPVLVDGTSVIFESLAICLYLADHFPGKPLAPPVSSEGRGPYLQWLVFAEATLDPVIVGLFLAAQLPEEGRVDLAPQRARAKALLTVVDARLQGREFVAGDSFTAADVSLASILHLAHNLKLLEEFPGLLDYVLRLTRRPASRRAAS